MTAEFCITALFFLFNVQLKKGTEAAAFYDRLKQTLLRGFGSNQWVESDEAVEDGKGKQEQWAMECNVEWGMGIRLKHRNSIKKRPPPLMIWLMLEI
jgi:hypothetical protein